MRFWCARCPFRAGRLVTMYNTYPKAGVERDGSSITNYYERRGRIPAFHSLSIYRYGTSILGETGVDRAQAGHAAYLRIFSRPSDAGPALGRVFTDAETTYQTDNVVIVTRRLLEEAFQRRSAGDRPQDPRLTAV